jgi:hypothetical protein
MLAKIKEQINNLFNNNAFAVKREQVEDSQFILFMEENGYLQDKKNPLPSFVKQFVFENKSEVTIVFQVSEKRVIHALFGKDFIISRYNCTFYFNHNLTWLRLSAPHDFDIDIFSEEDIKMSEMIVEFISYFASKGKLESESNNIFWVRCLNPSQICLNATIEVVYKKQTIKLSLKLPGLNSIKTNVKFKTIKDLGPREAFRQAVIESIGISLNPFPLF